MENVVVVFFQKRVVLFITRECNCTQVIGWLLSHEFIEEVIALDSPHLEAYLHSRIAQQPGGGGGVALRKLLWRQLESRGARLEAAQVLEHLGTCADDENGGNLQLDDRLDYLARAIITIKALPRTPVTLCSLCSQKGIV